MIKKYERDFKGVWIEKSRWLDENLTKMEMLFVVEVESLDNENGCFATNEYFSSFFRISASRCIRIISSLEAKGYIKRYIIYKEGSKQIKKRILKVVTPPGENASTLLAKTPVPSWRKRQYPPGENARYNNTVNNTVNNTIKKKEKEKESSLDKSSSLTEKIANALPVTTPSVDKSTSRRSHLFLKHDSERLVIEEQTQSSLKNKSIQLNDFKNKQTNKTNKTNRSFKKEAENFKNEILNIYPSEKVEPRDHKKLINFYNKIKTGEVNKQSFIKNLKDCIQLKQAYMYLLKNYINYDKRYLEDHSAKLKAFVFAKNNNKNINNQFGFDEFRKQKTELQNKGIQADEIRSVNHDDPRVGKEINGIYYESINDIFKD